MINKITETTKTLIDQESSVLGSDINYQLKQARLKALDNTKIVRNIFFRAWFTPATALATMAFYFMMPLLNIDDKAQPMELEVYVDVNDIELIEQLELVENLEFYEWLSQEQEMSSI